MPRTTKIKLQPWIGVILYGLILIIQLCCMRDVLCQLPDTLLIVFSANTNAQLLDCGCDSVAAGGLPRRMSAIRQLRQRYGDILLVDGGDFLGTTDRQLQNDVVLEAYRQFQYDAVALGDQEFWNGWEFFRKKVNNGALPLFCSNFPETLPPNLAVHPEILRQSTIKKQRIAVTIFSLLQPTSFQFFPEERLPPISWSEMATALNQQLIIADKPNQLRVVLFHGDLFTLEQLRSKFPNIDIWLVAHQTGESPTTWQALQSPFVVFVDLDGRSLQLLQVVSTSDTSRFIFQQRRLILSEEFPPDSSVQLVAQAFYDDLRRAQTAKAKNGVGAQTCRQCHLLTYERWQNTAHATAMQKLLLPEQRPDQRCLDCHRSGVESGVGCDACHQVSKNHGEWGVKDLSASKDAKNCGRCHTKKWSPNFVYSLYWQKINH